MAEKQLNTPLMEDQGLEMMTGRRSTSLEIFDTVLDVGLSKGAKDDMAKVTAYLKELAPAMIDTPFKGSSLVMTRDEKKFVFGSREGRLGVVDRDSKQVTLDVDLNQGSIWTLKMIQNDAFILSAGASGEIKKLKYPEMQVIDEFKGHNGEINFIQVSADESIMYTCGDDGTVRKWPLNAPANTAESEVLYSHRSLAYCCDLSLDNNYIGSASNDRTAKVYSLKSKELLSTMSSRSPLWALKLSSSNKFVAGGDQGGTVYIWNFGTWDLQRELTGHTARVRYMDLAIDDSILVTAGLDHDIKVWDMKLGRKEITLKGHQDWVKFTLISSDMKTIFSCADDCKVASWRIPKFTDQVTVKHENDEFKSIDCGEKLIFARCDSRIVAYDYKGVKVVELPLENFNIVNHQFDKGGNFLYAFAQVGEAKKLLGWNLQLMSRSVDFDIKQDNLFSGLVFSNKQFIATGENVRVNIWKVEDMSIVHTFRSHKGAVVKLAISNDCKFLFSSDNDGILKVYDTLAWTEIHTINESGSYTIIQPSKDDEYLFVCTTSNELKIYNLHRLTLVHSISDFTSTKLVFTEDNDYFIYCTASKVYIRDMDNFEIVLCLTLQIQIVDFALSSDESMILMTTGTGTSMISNPLKCEGLSIFGESDALYEYIIYCNKVIGGTATHEPKFDEWIIKPYHVNTVHLYVNCNLPELLNAAVVNHSPFYPSRTGHTPLSIAVEKKFVDAIEAIYKGFKYRYENGDPWAFYHVGDSLVGLNNISFDNLHRIYESGLYRITDDSLPKFAAENASLPLVVVSEHPTLDKGDFNADHIFVDEGKAIAFGQTLFRISMFPGSQHSLDLVQSILDCENERIYYTKLVKMILDYKWKQVRGMIGIQALVYIAYLVLLALYSLDFDKYEWFMIFPFLVSSLLFAYEGLQMYNSGIDYFDDAWNYIDIVRGLLFNTYCIMVWVSLMEEYQRPIFTLTVLFSWIRGITYFRLFERTRYLIKLIMEASVDILSFFVLLFYSTMAFAFIMQSLDLSNPSTAVCGGEKNFEISCYFLTSYIQNLGELSASPYSILTWVLFIIISIVNPVIMLNLLISIMGDTYGRVKDGKVVADARELAGMILEVETLMGWNREVVQKAFIKVACEESFLNIEDEGIDGKIKALKDVIQSLGDNIRYGKDEILNVVNDCREEIIQALRNR